MYNTGNPLGSKDILDLYDNSENIDYFANSQLDEHPDRFGSKRLTLAGLIKRSMALRNEINDFSGALTFKPEWSDVPMNVSESVGGEGGALNLQAEALGNRTEINKISSREALRRTYLEVGLNLVEGSFEEGGVLVSANDILLQGRTGRVFAGPAGAVPAGTNPASEGFVDRTETLLCVSLESQPESIKKFGAKVDGVTDDTSAILLAASTAKRIYVPDTGHPAIVDGLVLDGIVGLEIYGPGMLKSKNGSETPTLRIQNASDWYIGKFLKIDGNRANRSILSSRNLGAGLSIYNCQGYQVHGVEVFGAVSGAGILAIDDGPGSGDFSRPSSVKYCHVHDCGKSTSGHGLCDGMFLNQDNMTAHFNHVHDCTDYGIAGDYSRNMSIRWNRINNVLVGVGVLGAKVWDVCFNWISNVGQGVSVTLSGNPVSDLYTSRVVHIFGNWISNVTRDPSGTPNGDAVFVDPSAVDVDIQRNFVDTAYRGLASSAQGTKMIGNRVANCTNRGIFNSAPGSVSRDNTLIATAGEYYGTTEADKDVQGGGVRTLAIVTAFIGGWTSSSAGFAQAGYYKRDGRVYLKGAINPGTQSPGQVIFILPEGFRSSTVVRFSVVSENNITYVLQVSPDGSVSYRSGTGGSNIQLDQISFTIA